MEKNVTLSYANCLKEFTGDSGITADELKALQSKIRAAHESIREQKESGRLGFMNLPYDTETAKKIKAAAKKLAPKFENFVVVGIGGSALGNIALQQALRHPQWNLLSKKDRRGYPRLFVPDNVDPEMISGLIDVLDVKKTVFNVISKSGDTAECMANYFIFRKILERKLGKKFRDHLIFTTDAHKGYLRDAANKDGILSFEVPGNVGGRFTVMSPVGLLSAAFTGIDIEKLLAGARMMDARCASENVLENPAALYAAVQYLFYWLKHPISVMMPYSNALYGISDWYRQLWAESLGKKTSRDGAVVNVGPTPVKALGATDQHSQVQLYIEGPNDKIITFLSVDKFAKSVAIPSVDKHYLGKHTLNELIKAEEEATRLALTKEGRPNMTITLPEINPQTVGQVLYMLELATAYAGELFNIDAFNQPGVELGKQLTYALMGRSGYEQKKAEIEGQLANSKKAGFTV